MEIIMTAVNEKMLGFGLMRLPSNEGKIDIDRVSELADMFIGKSFTYFDTAYVYAGSEAAFEEAVAKRYPRSAYTVASKMAGWLLSDSLTPESMFNEQLERCGVSYFDYYLLHSLQPSRIAAYENFDCWNFCLGMKAEGKIRNFGFSFHGAPDLLDDLLSRHPEVDFVQLQLNYVDWNNNVVFAGENYEVARKHGKDIIVMEPVKGGFLADMAPELKEKFRGLDERTTPASFALRFAGSLPGVKVVLSGMNTLEQMAENTEIFSNFRPLSDRERNVISQVTAELLSLPTVPCADCRYCVKGCPMGIRIPEIFKAYNLILTFGEHFHPHLYYDAMKKLGGSPANACVGCGQCEGACPQHIGIVEKLKAASDIFDK